MKNIAANIRAHHERIDGEGFPDGLKGSDISQSAQILGMVETYFELMEGELTGTAMSSMQAIKSMYAQVDKAFDRTILDAFLVSAKKMALNLEQQINAPIPNPAPESASLPASALIAPQTPETAPVKKSSYRPGRGEDPAKKDFTFKVLSALINTYSGAKIDDRRDEKSGFLWVYSGSKRSDENQKLDDWLKKNGFIYDGKLSGWYYPFD